ncbi:hypothetical protein [Paenibacillus sp. FSL R5-0701]|uniref:hypothetical protein n=1 Tax=Paenibacillus sp. FSL R5-0701 TaxID=2921654 RepID=UPI0030CF5CBA
MKNSIKNLGLLFVGAVIGVTISFAPDIQAATSKLLGGEVAKVITVKKDGVVIGEGGIINNTTYLPVRTVVNSVDGIEVGSVNSSEVNLVSTSENQTSDHSIRAKQEEEKMWQETEEYNKKYNALRSEIKKTENEIRDTNYKINIEQSTSYKVSKIYVDNFENGKGGSMREEDYNYYKSELDRMNTEKKEAQTSLPTLEAELADLEAQLAALK